MSNPRAHHIHGPNTPCQIGCPAHPVKRMDVPPTACWCGEGRRHRYWPGVMHWQCPAEPVSPQHIPTSQATS